MPERIGRYEIIGELGKGAMGVVYKAADPNIGRTVALKSLRVDVHGIEAEEMLQRFKNEARAAGLLSHPNIVTIYDAGEHDGIFYIAMEFIEGRTLQAILREEHVLPVEKTADIVRQVCAGLEYAHARGIIHRDVKPANIMVQADGTAKIMDFGIAKNVGTGLTSTGQVLGTPNYMSPEQVKGRKLDGRSDLFSVGVIVYECLTGERPFAGDNVTTIIYKIVNENPPAPCELDITVPPAMSAVVMRALAKMPEARFQSGAELACALLLQDAPPAETVTLPSSTGPVSTVAAAAAATPQLAPVDSTVLHTPRAVAPTAPARKSHGTAAALLVILAVALAAAGYVGVRWKQHRASLVARPPITLPPPVTPAVQNPPPKPPPAAVNAEAPKPAEERPTTGELRVSSTPPGAKVDIDGHSDPKWLTPFTAQRLKPGAHRITVALDGYAPQTLDVRVTAGERASISPELRAVELAKDGPNPLRRLKRLFGSTEDRGTLEIRTRPRGAQIWFNGKLTPQRTPVRVPMPPGTYRIGLRKTGYKPIDRTVTIEKGKSLGVEEVMEKE